MNLYIFFLTLVPFVNGNTITLEENNFVSLRGPIYKETSNKFFSDLKQFQGNELNIFINSPGGSVMEGMKMIEYIKVLQDNDVTVNCVADFAASMAFVILQSCSNRYTLNSGVLMQHQMSLGVEGPFENLQNYLKMIDDIDRNLNSMQAKRVKMTPEDFSRQVMNDWWVSGFSAKEENIVDDIIMVKCDKNLFNGKSNLKLSTFFGDIEMVFSNCPLLRNPLKVKYENIINDSNSKNMKELNNIVNSFDSSSYNLKKIKSWL